MSTLSKYLRLKELMFICTYEFWCVHLNISLTILNMLCTYIRRIRILEEVLAIRSHQFAYQGENPENFWLMVRITVSYKVEDEDDYFFATPCCVSRLWWLYIHSFNRYFLSVWCETLCQVLAIFSSCCHRAFGVEEKYRQGSGPVTVQDTRGRHSNLWNHRKGVHFLSPSTILPRDIWLQSQRWVFLLGSLGNRTGFSRSTWIYKPLTSEIDFPRIGKHF